MGEGNSFNPNATRRRAKAKEGDRLSISHFKGNLHTHTRTDLTKPTTPEAIVGVRRGSNCGKVPLTLLAQYHAQEMGNAYLAITDHSRDGDPDLALKDVTNWFEGLYLGDDTWLQEQFGCSRAQLTGEDERAVKTKAAEQAEKLALYGDGRLEDVLAEIEAVSGTLPMRVFRGIEANLLPDGTYDTSMVKQGKFELVNCSIHPNVDPSEFKGIVNDHGEYTDLVIRGIDHPRTNIMCHIGFDCGIQEGESLSKAEKKARARVFIEDLDWDRIANAAIENNVAIEVNVKEVMDCIYQEMLDYDRFPTDSTTYREYFRQRLDEIVPILSSTQIGETLKPYFEKGLKIAINTDEHGNPYVNSEVTEEGVEGSFRDRDFRFWRCLKIAEGYFNNVFEDLCIGQENIINTYSVEELEFFLINLRYIL